LISYPAMIVSMLLAAYVWADRPGASDLGGRSLSGWLVGVALFSALALFFVGLALSPYCLRFERAHPPRRPRRAGDPLEHRQRRADLPGRRRAPPSGPPALGFFLGERQVRRAGLDYWPRVDPVVWDRWEDFEPQLPNLGEPFFLSTGGERDYWSVEYPERTVLVFGKESAGLSPEIRAR
jgi:hypothetical protein